TTSGPDFSPLGASSRMVRVVGMGVSFGAGYRKGGGAPWAPPLDGSYESYEALRLSMGLAGGAASGVGGGWRRSPTVGHAWMAVSGHLGAADAVSAVRHGAVAAGRAAADGAGVVGGDVGGADGAAGAVESAGAGDHPVGAAVAAKARVAKGSRARRRRGGGGGGGGGRGGGG